MNRDFFSVWLSDRGNRAAIENSFTYVSIPKRFMNNLYGLGSLIYLKFGFGCFDFYAKLGLFAQNHAKIGLHKCNDSSSNFVLLLTI